MTACELILYRLGILIIPGQKVCEHVCRNGLHICDTGKQETKLEKLKSILAQFEYKHQVMFWVSKGVPFDTHLYVPKIHPITGCEFCEHEDEGHVFKVCATKWKLRY